MNRTLSTALTFSLGLVASTAALADPVAGAIIGGGAGAVIGHTIGGRNGAVVGGVIGDQLGKKK